jgi:hypothetical protein
MCGVVASFVIILLTVTYILTFTFYILTGSYVWSSSFIRHYTANSALH